MTARTVWIGGTPTTIPQHARVTHVAGERHAIVAVPSWRAVLVGPTGTVEAPDAATNQQWMAEFFPDLESSSGHP